MRYPKTKHFNNRPARNTSSAGAGDVVGPAGATDLAIARFDGATGKLLKSSSAFTISDLGIQTTIAANAQTTEFQLFKNQVSTGGFFNVGLLADGDAITIIVDVAGKDDSSNTGFGGRFIATWTKAAGVMQLVGETGGVLSNIDTGGTATLTSSDSGASGVTITLTIGGGTGNASWACAVKTIQYKA